MTDEVKGLVFYMGDKLDDELWLIVQEACRDTTPEWRAYERLRSIYSQMKRKQEQIERAGTEMKLTRCEIAIEDLDKHFDDIVGKPWANLIPKRYWKFLIDVPRKIIKKALDEI